MNPNYKHDFSSASIKHQIETEFYQKSGEYLTNKGIFGTIITGPDYQRHIDNYRKYISSGNLRICEINTDIFISLYQGNKSNSNIQVVNKSIELYGSQFIDCDLTCTSDLDVIKKTLLKQIEAQASSGLNHKAFIFSFGLRTSGIVGSKDHYLRPIIGLLGASIGRVVTEESKIKIKAHECKWIKPVKIHGSKGRIKDYICYSYNAGGGPMLTCLLIYK